MDLERYTEGGETARTAVSSLCVFQAEFPRLYPDASQTRFRLLFFAFPRGKSIARHRGGFSRLSAEHRELYQNRRAGIKRGGSKNQQWPIRHLQLKPKLRIRISCRLEGQLSRSRLHMFCLNLTAHCKTSQAASPAPETPQHCECPPQHRTRPFSPRRN